jgi:hypothetical protein
MADESKTGTDWRDDELDAIVSDYFEMLEAELQGRPFIKAQHRKALMAQIGRSEGAVEFKHQNISAVMDALGMPWISGYKPAINYQEAIFDAIDRYLTQHPSYLEIAPRAPAAIHNPLERFVPTPVRRAPTPLPQGLERLVRKFDPVERDHRNRSLGKAGEEFVFKLERRRLSERDRSDLATKVRWIAAEDGDGAGYDILSFDPNGKERLLEVKTTNGSARTPFFLTNNERALALERPDHWQIYRVHLFAKEPRIFTVVPPLENAVNLRPETWRASF